MKQDIIIGILLVLILIIIFKNRKENMENDTNDTNNINDTKTSTNFETTPVVNALSVLKNNLVSIFPKTTQTDVNIDKNVNMNKNLDIEGKVNLEKDLNVKGKVNVETDLVVKGKINVEGDLVKQNIKQPIIQHGVQQYKNCSIRGHHEHTIKFPKPFKSRPTISLTNGRNSLGEHKWGAKVISFDNTKFKIQHRPSWKGNSVHWVAFGN